MVDDLYEGLSLDYLGCQSCGFSRQREEKFRDLELEIFVPNVLESLRLYKNQEILSGDNQWYCDRCSGKVDAVKGLKLKQLPPILTLHLKRFSFDFNLMKRIKLNNAFGLVPTLNTADFMTSDMIEGDGDEYELFAIMIHQGTARGGHYFAYIKPPQGEDWFEFNDVNVKRLDPAHVQQGFDMAAAASARAAPAPAPAATPAPAPATPGAVSATAADSAVSPPTDAVEKPEQPGTAPTETATAAGGEGKPEVSSELTPEVPPKVEAKKENESTPSAVSVVANNMCHNAYLVMYRKVGHGHDKQVDLPTPLQAMVNAENDVFAKMQRVFAIRQAVVVLEVYTADNRKVQLDVPASRTLEEATAIAYDALFGESAVSAVAESGGSLSPPPPIERCRLRRFVPSCSRPTETFEDREPLPLHTIGLGNAATMLLETRNADEVFEAFNPNEMVVRLLQWDSEANATDSASAQMVKVDGDQEATVAQLTTAVERVTGVPAHLQRLVYMDDRKASVVTLSEPSTELRREFRFRSGEDIVMEVLTEADDMSGESPVVRKFDLERNVITICYNHPDKPDEVDLITPSNLNETLAELKAKLARDLEIDAEDFHLRRSAIAPQFKDETKTLRELGLVDQSMVFVSMGAPMAPDQFALEVFIYDADNPKRPFERIISDFPASETQSIGSLKRRIAAHARVNHPANKLRLRDKSRTAAGKIYRDGQSVRGAMRHVADGKQVCIQLLDFVERTTREDMVIALRIWRPLKRTIRLSDVVVKRRNTVSELYDLLNDRYGIGLASAAAPDGEVESKGDDAATEMVVAGSGAAAAAALSARVSPAGPDASGTADTVPTAEFTATETPGGEAAVALESAAAAPAAAPSVTHPGVTTENEAEAEAVRKALASYPRSIGLVKMPTFPKLNLKTVWKYKWNQPKLTGDQVLSMSGFRDGTVFVVRDEAEFAVAKVRAAARRAAKAAASGGTTDTKKKARPGRRRWAPPKNRGQAFSSHENNLTIGGGSSTAKKVSSGPDWSCPACTFANAGSRRTCEMCGTKAPAASAPAPAPAEAPADAEPAAVAASSATGGTEGAATAAPPSAVPADAPDAPPPSPSPAVPSAASS